MTPTFDRMYIRMRPSVIVNAHVKNTSATPKMMASTKARTLTRSSRVIALSGVFRVGDTFPSHAGTTPERPIAYQVLVPPLKQAIDTAIVELSRANRSKIHAPAQTR